MQVFHTTNYLISEKAGENLYLNNFEESRNDYIPNVVYVNMYDKGCTRKIVSAGNKHYNPYYAYINAQAMPTRASVKRTVANDYGTARKILFYAVFSGVPCECVIDGQVYSPELSEGELEAIVAAVKATCEKYPFAEVVVSSDILKYVNQNGKAADRLKSKVEALQKPKLSYSYDYAAISESTYYLVVSNRESLLFVHCNAQNVPCALAHNCERERVCDRYLTCAYLGCLEDASFEVFESPDEFYTIPADVNVSPDTDVHFAKFLANVRYMNKELLSLPAEAAPTKLHLFNDAMMLKGLLGNAANADLAELTPEIGAEGTVVVTLNKFDSFHKRCRENPTKPLSWLCFDFDCVNSPCEEKIMRFYANNYASYKQIYDFASLEELRAKFGLPNIVPVDFNRKGCIVVCLDNPFGPNYVNMQSWVDEWRSCFERLVGRFPVNPILVRPYLHQPAECAAFYESSLSGYPNVRLDPSILETEFSEYLRAKREELLFCLKRQGAEFVKCFLAGTIMISGLKSHELEEKPDAKMISQYEYTLDHLLSGEVLENLQGIKNFYNANRFENLKKMTSHFVALDDLESGYFLRELFSA